MNRLDRLQAQSRVDPLGDLAGRVKQARRVLSSQNDGLQESYPVALSGDTDGDEKWKIDTFTVASAGLQTLSLSKVPLDYSEHVYWHPAGGLGIYQQGDQWSRPSGSQVLTLGDKGNYLAAGDKVTVEYAYLNEQATTYVLYDSWELNSTTVTSSFTASNKVLVAGRKYRVSIDGTASWWPQGTTWVYGAGVPTKYANANPSGPTSGQWDAEWLYANVAGSPGTYPVHNHAVYFTINNSTPTGANSRPSGVEAEPWAGIPGVPNPNRIYEYDMLGQGFVMKTCCEDTNPNDNPGKFKFNVYEVIEA